MAGDTGANAGGGLRALAATASKRDEWARRGSRRAARGPRAAGMDVRALPAALLAAIAALGWTPGAAAAGGPTPDAPEATSTTVLVLGTLLVMFGIMVEKGQEHLLESVSSAIRPVLDSLFEELTLLGVIGLVLFLLEQSSVLTTISKAVFGDLYEGWLLHLFHEVHMVLFLVMVIFLSEVLMLVYLATWQSKKWFLHETQAMDRKGIVRAASRFLVQPSRFGCAALRSYRARNRAYDQVVYSAFRNRFIRPPEAGETTITEETPKPKVQGGLVEMALTPSNAVLHQKRFMVYAFQTTDPIKVDKHWGESKGARNDWVIVGLDNDIYVCPDDVFTKSYVPVKGRPNQFRKEDKVLARKMDVPFSARTDKGAQRGAAGSYLLQPPGPGGENNQYTVTEEEFKKTYEPVKGHMSDVESSQHLRGDFNFGLYLTILLGKSLAEIVEVKVATWFVVQCVILLFWAVYMVTLEGDAGVEEVGRRLAASSGSDSGADKPNSVVFVTVGLFFGYVLLLCVALLLRKLIWIREQMTSPEILNAAKLMEAKHAALARGADGMAVGGGAGTKKVTPGGEYAVSEPSARSVGSREASVPIHQDQTPPFELRKLRPREGRCSHRMGRPANRHEQLFWFDHHGPHVLEHMIRALMLCMALYIASATSLFTADCATSGALCVLIPLIVAIPPLGMAFMMPIVIKNYVLVANVESMRKRYVIQEVVRQQKTVRSMRALRLLTAMKVYAMMDQHKEVSASGRHVVPTHSAASLLSPGEKGASGKLTLVPIDKADGEGKDAKDDVTAAGGAGHDDKRVAFATNHPTSVGKAIAGAAERAYGGRTSARYLQRRQQVMEAFALFDRDATGEVSTENVRAVLELLGVADTSEMVAELIIREIDVDNTGTIEFDEFFDWLATKEASAESNSQELTHHIFELIDRDHSNTISVAELRDTLSSLGEVMSHDDVQHIIREADENGDGQIDIHEFSEMMKRSFEHCEFSL